MLKPGTAGRSLRYKVLLLVTVLLAAAAVFLAYRMSRPLRVSLELMEKAPLTALAEVRTREPARLHLTIAGRDGNDLKVEFSGFAEHHRIPVLGLYPDYRNTVEVTAETKTGELLRRSVTVRTRALPEHYPKVRLKRRLPERIAPGMTFLHLAHYDAEGTYHPLPSAVDRHGRVRWFYDGDIGHLLRRLDEGTFLIQREDSLVEIDMLGRDTGRRITVENGIHHDAAVLPDGNFLVLTAAPGSYEDGVVEVDRQGGGIVRSWDFREILDPERPRQPRNLEKDDWLHLNAVTYDPASNGIVVSGRDQSAVVKIDRESGKLRWILGNHRYWKQEFRQYLLEPQGEPFAWPWGQHAPMLHPQQPGRILIFDNGNKRSYDNPLPPEENYSRAVEYAVNPQTMEVRQLWEYGRRYGSELYTPFIGDANYLPNGNRLVCFGGITRNLQGEPVEIFDWEQREVRRMKISARIIEVTADSPAREVMELSFRDPDPGSYRGYRCYRAVRMPLYPASLRTKVPARSSSKARRSSSLLFMTIGPRHAMGSASGRPEM